MSGGPVEYFTRTTRKPSPIVMQTLLHQVFIQCKTIEETCQELHLTEAQRLIVYHILIEGTK